MRIVIFGTGGVGGYFGGRLALGGEDVTFIARGEHLQALLKGGLRVDSIKGDFSLHPIKATADTTQVGHADAVLVCVKTWQVPEVAKAILPMVGDETIVVPLENGVDAPAQLAEVLGTQHVLGGMCRIASQIVFPGHIQHSGIEPYIAFGELDGHPSLRTKSLCQAFEHAGVWAEIPPNIQVAMWQKFLFIAAVSGVGAVARVPIGILRPLEGTRQMLEAALQESFNVAMAYGINLPADIVDKTMAYIDTLPPATIASMQRDIMEGRPSELEAQNGAIVHMGQMHNIPTPVHAFIYHSLLPQEILARGQEV
jgi:2-dehydropantoate 2-reductase